MCTHSNPITNVVRKVQFPKHSKKIAMAANYEASLIPYTVESKSLLEMSPVQIKKYLKHG